MGSERLVHPTSLEEPAVTAHLFMCADTCTLPQQRTWLSFRGNNVILMNISELALCRGSRGRGGDADSSIYLMNVAGLMLVGRGGCLETRSCPPAPPSRARNDQRGLGQCQYLCNGCVWTTDQHLHVTERSLLWWRRARPSPSHYIHFKCSLTKEGVA